ncbi:hypothetical protein THAOC_03245 [Thalassiosira oceanica]|uniref:Uncharacterized protein n=1 Tax=Thalassiosira oceanica TaxID=159749 RepID=K0TC27_THAOC|nr:hypothetical protein THAOC_03245 [Thalassiosira oceanica]|eukprot:EJK75045.1 hypothetical protein THAOC_03245 [Thalassiosira oceanica]
MSTLGAETHPRGGNDSTATAGRPRPTAGRGASPVRATAGTTTTTTTGGGAARRYRARDGSRDSAAPGTTTAAPRRSTAGRGASPGQGGATTTTGMGTARRDRASIPGRLLRWRDRVLTANLNSGELSLYNVDGDNQNQLGELQLLMLPFTTSCFELPQEWLESYSGWWNTSSKKVNPNYALRGYIVSPARTCELACATSNDPNYAASSS